MERRELSHCGKVWSEQSPDSKTLVYTVSQKTVQNCFCQNFVKFPPILIIFVRKMAKRLELCEVQSLSTSGGSRTCKRGDKVERRRREYRGAEGAEGVECGEGFPPTHWGRGLVWSAPSPENFFDFRSKNV